MYYVWSRHGNFHGALGGKNCRTEQQAINRAKKLGVPAPWVQRADKFKTQCRHPNEVYYQHLEYLS